jgi:hypothetical protein
MSSREWILLNPGAANPTSRVRAALVMRDLCHREPEVSDRASGGRARIGAPPPGGWGGAGGGGGPE